MAYGQCECLRWAWAPEMGPRSGDGHHPNCSEGHPEGCDCLRCCLDKPMECCQKGKDHIVWREEQNTSPLETGWCLRLGIGQDWYWTNVSYCPFCGCLLEKKTQRVTRQSSDVEGCVMSVDTGSLEGRLAKLEKEHEDLKASVATNALSIATLAGLGESLTSIVQRSRKRSMP